MDRELLYFGITLGLLLLFQRLKRRFLLFSLVVLPGTFCHELCHLCVGGLLNGKPARFTILPRREGHGYVLGSVAFAQVRWYNAFFLGMAPLALLPAAWTILTWRLGLRPALGWGEVLWLYLVANLAYASLPSWQDLRIAARSPIGWLLLAGAGACGWFRFRRGPPPSARFPTQELQQLQEARLSGLHAPFGDPGADLRLGQAHEIG